jgi:hypothetical protein
VVTQRDPLIDATGAAVRHALKTRTLPPDSLGRGGLGLTEYDIAECVLDALPTLLLADSPAGDRLRTRLGLRLDRTLANLGPNGVAMYGGPVNDRTRLVALHSGWFEVSDE